MRILLLTPPLVQLNTPYPATPYLAGFLRLHADRLGLEVAQADPALELFLRLFSRNGIGQIRAAIGKAPRPARRGAAGAAPEHPAVTHFRTHAGRYAATVEAAVRFLQGRDPSLALRIAGRDFLPEGPRFAALDGPDEPETWAFGALGTTDRARHLASLFVDDLADVIREGVDERFGLARYAEKLAASAPTFDAIAAALGGPPTLVDRLVDDLGAELVRAHRPDLVGLTIPFPGNVYGAFRLAAACKHAAPGTFVALGGGYVNTELRGLCDPRVFDHCDFVTLDDGERPLLCLIEHLQARAAGEAPPPLFRTFVRRTDADGRPTVVLETDERRHDVPLRDAGTPTYDGLTLERYVSLFEMLNPMHRLWSDGRWNKLTVAHGCYWKKCTFCDVTLDYIARYDPVSADVLVDRIERLVAETGQTGFHFVDEAAPPAGLRALAERLIARNLVITWWGNIRFEKTFTPELAALLARSGCVALTGGLEVASNRLLDLMKKGVTVEQVARVTSALAEAGIMVHAYLMYGFPTETTQETVDALEYVRQLFAAGCLQSAFWHRFAATAHSPVGQAPHLYGIRLRPEPPTTFARNELPFDDPTGTDHDHLGEGLRRAIYNFMHGLGLDEDVRSWFAPPQAAPGAGRRRGGPQGSTLPATTVPPDFVARALLDRAPERGRRRRAS
jgi:radical SAM superfamily enzyme YgiQ (UPF0313 family)